MTIYCVYFCCPYEEDIPKGYLKHGNRLIKLHNPYAESPRLKKKDKDYE